MVLSSTYQSTSLPLLSTLYEPPPKHLISVLVSHTATVSTSRQRGRATRRGRPRLATRGVAAFSSAVH